MGKAVQLFDEKSRPVGIRFKFIWYEAPRKRGRPGKMMEWSDHPPVNWLRREVLIKVYFENGEWLMEDREIKLLDQEACEYLPEEQLRVSSGSWYAVPRHVLKNKPAG